MSLPYDPSLLYSMGLANQAGLPSGYPGFNRHRYYPPHYQQQQHSHQLGGLQSRSGSGNTHSNSLSHILDTFFDPANRIKVRDHAARIEIAENGDFSYKLDAGGFDPDEINVCVEGDNLIIRGEHKSETPDEAVERVFMRRVRIPQDIQKETINCTTNENGFLTVTAKKSGAMSSEIRQIPVQFKPAISGEGSQEGTPKFKADESPNNSGTNLGQILKKN